MIASVATWPVTRTLVSPITISITPVIFPFDVGGTDGGEPHPRDRGRAAAIAVGFHHEDDSPAVNNNNNSDLQQV